jgi:Vanadium chloroperoxidase N-terminal domain
VKHKLATTLVVVAALVVATFSTATTTTRPARAASGDFPTNGCPEDPTKKPPCDDDDVILRWNEQLLATIRQSPTGTGPTGPTITSRALGVLHTATYDAWAAYDRAKATLQNGNTDQPLSSDPAVNDANKSKAISVAAYETLSYLFPNREPIFADHMEALEDLGYFDLASDPTAAANVGHNAAQAVITYRKGDGSNQTQNPDGTVSYPCTPAGSGIPCPYKPTRNWNEPTDPWRWQPLCVPLGETCKPPPTNPGPSQQAPTTPQWGNIKSFASLVALQTKVPPPPKTTADIDLALADTNLSGPNGDLKKVTAEYWADGPSTEFPPGHMAVFAQFLCRKRQNNLDTDVKFFFALGNALLDAGIASWWQKYKWDFWRPITAIRHHYYNKDVTSWLGPGGNPSNGNFGTVKGQDWKPYQAANVVTPPFPEYVSGHSTFSAAGNVIMVGFTGSDNFGGSVTISALNPDGTPWSKIEPGTPANPVTLYWPTFTAMANDAGISRRYGGIHFKSGDLQARSLGNMVGQNVWSRAQSYFRGTIGYNT